MVAQLRGQIKAVVCASPREITMDCALRLMSTASASNRKRILHGSAKRRGHVVRRVSLISGVALTSGIT